MSQNNGNDSIINKTANDVLLLSRNSLIVNLRFLDIALGRLELTASDHATLATDGRRLIYGPKHILRNFRNETTRPTRDYLHTVIHCIFSHMFVGTLVDRQLWDLACDIAAESTIGDLGLRVTESERQAEQKPVIDMLRYDVGILTAEKIYHYFREADIPEEDLETLSRTFKADDHSDWYGRRDRRKDKTSDQDEQEKHDEEAYDDSGSIPGISPEALEAEWKEIAEKIQDDLETFSKEQGDDAGDLMQNLRAVNREKYDYTAFLRKFARLGEAMMVNDEEFDNIFYTYGLRLYKNMPLVEPLEYKEIKRIRDFVIAIDTSGSTSGDLVQRFLQKTYNILKSSESYFSRVNIHIIQCDADVQEHVRITSEKEFDDYISSMEILGLGGTDFRPVFSLVDEMIAGGEFTDLRGLIYFTDGFGTFPVRGPRYETAFVFLDNAYNNPEVPPWAIKLVLQDEEM